MTQTTAAPKPNQITCPPATWLIGVDIGGTKIAAALVDSVTCKLEGRVEVPTNPQRGGKAVLGTVLALCRELAYQAPTGVAAIGVGICELVDPQGQVQSSHTVSWQGLPIQETLSQIAPALVESDVRAHALAEACIGAGVAYDLFAFITIGTGISSAIVLNQTPIAGAHGNALVLATSPIEVPNTSTLDARGRLVPPHTYVLEEYASGPALLARYQAETGKILTHGRELFRLAEEGELCAHAILESAGAALGNTIAFLVNILDPQAVILGGGLGLAGGIYWQSMEAATRRAIYGDATRDLPIRPAQLGADAGIIGAALAAHRRLTAHPSPGAQKNVVSP